MSITVSSFLLSVAESTIGCGYSYCLKWICS